MKFTTKAFLLSLFALPFAACDDDDNDNNPQDATLADANATDANATDANATDANATDASTETDATLTDASTETDATLTDASTESDATLDDASTEADGTICVETDAGYVECGFVVSVCEETLLSVCNLACNMTQQIAAQICNAANDEQAANIRALRESTQCQSAIDAVGINLACHEVAPCEEACAHVDECADMCGIDGLDDECATACNDNNAVRIRNLITYEQCDELMPMLGVTGARCDAHLSACGKKLLSTCGLTCMIDDGVAHYICANATEEGVALIMDLPESATAEQCYATMVSLSLSSMLCAPHRGCEEACADVNKCAHMCGFDSLEERCATACIDRNSHFIDNYIYNASCTNLMPILGITGAQCVTISDCKAKLDSVCGQACSLDDQTSVELCQIAANKYLISDVLALTFSSQCQELISTQLGADLACE